MGSQQYVKFATNEVQTTEFHLQNKCVIHFHFKSCWNFCLKYVFYLISGELENVSLQSLRNERNQEEFQELNGGLDQHDTNSQTSISSTTSLQRASGGSEFPSGSEEGKSVAELAVNREVNHMSTADSHEEEFIGTRSSFQTPTVVGLRTYGSMNEINDSDHKTEFDNKVLRNNESTRTPSPRGQRHPPLSHKNTSSYSATTNYNNSSNGYPFDPGETSLKTPFTTASPDSDRFSVDVATGVSATSYSQEATTEENSQPAPNSLPSVHAFMPRLNGSLNQNAVRNLTDDFGIEVVNVPS